VIVLLGTRPPSDNGKYPLAIGGLVMLIIPICADFFLAQKPTMSSKSDRNKIPLTSAGFFGGGSWA
jgi:hypothetical protein